jgi:hypothetical protein
VNHCSILAQLQPRATHKGTVGSPLVGANPIIDLCDR